jgi:biopolymer transport protein ExbD
MKTFLLFASLASLTVCLGCATPGEAPARVVVEARDATHFIVEGREVDAGHLPRAVKKAGATQDTEIRLQVPPQMPPGSMLPAFAALQQAGYRKVLLAHPREATAQVKEPEKTAPPAKRALKPSRHSTL